ncbi:hypothetical protein [Actinoplanes xinjiangensis]|uniref:Uncharacterized protein n=1 Tax=Actinoplanes xinjiangensis TaxID=512350 RepID=A0A316EKS2_9ACTN|nr:hypothetical protein [Actinoplanes xinjiangensis]PWK31069.1 hypothetical protein BC793_13566 [Actinoplanes xinjiangensis]GIF44159.1 hypothetical protein Axi01nite_84700 [Actinoplanes xinjiangensis]
MTRSCDVDAVDEDDLIVELRTLVDETAPPAPDTVDVAGSGSFRAAERRVRAFFQKSFASAVTVTVGDRPVGVVTRAMLWAAEGTAAEPGTGERLEPLGDSTRYRLLVFACRPCGLTAHRMHHDTRDLPRCAHGRMELRR